TSVSNLTFQSLNTSVATNITSSGSLNLNGGKLLVELESDGHAPNSEHIQIIYSKSGCPLDSDDANGDGIIDYQEAIGEATELLPLTSDFSSNGEYPSADESGKYKYQASQDSSLDKSSLEGRVIIIHGVSNSVTLPDTVQGKEGLDVHQSLPVACAVVEFEEEQTTGGTGGTGDSTDTT